MRRPIRLLSLASARFLAPRRGAPRRQKILVLLTTSRSAVAIASHIQRPVPIATGDLAAVRRRGLVPRIGPAI
jgi:hypothetical protein